MLALVHYFIDLCLLRRNPQDLPASAVLFGSALVVALLAGVLLSVTAGASVAVALAQSLLDLLLTLGVLHLALKVMKKEARYLQAATALAGADAVISVVALVPVGLAMPAPGAEPSPDMLLGVLMFLALVAWGVLVVGHILRHAFDISLTQAVLLAIALDVFSFVIINTLIQGPA